MYTYICYHIYYHVCCFFLSFSSSCHGAMRYIHRHTFPTAAVLDAGVSHIVAQLQLHNSVSEVCMLPGAALSDFAASHAM